MARIARASSTAYSVAPAPAPPGFRHATAQVDGATIHYLIGGHGPPVVLLHGMHQLGFTQVLLVGHDMGGPVAFAYAADHPQEVQKLVLVETLLPGFGLEDLKATGAWHIGLAQVPELPETLVAGRERAFLGYFYRRGMLRAGAVGEADFAEYLRTYAAPGRISASFEYYRALKADAPEFRAMVATHKLSMSVLAVGAERGFGSGAASFRPLAEHLREVIIQGSGHHIPDDQPQALAGALGTFFVES